MGETMKRRDFLKNTALAGAALPLSNYILKSKPESVVQKMSEIQFLKDDSIMIIIELFGGNDGLNTIIPVLQDEYYNLRPNIAIQPEDAVRFQNTDLFMHPALVTDIYNDGMMGLLRNGNLAIIEGVGYQGYSMSHFRSADIWSSGVISTDPNVKLLEGWLGRYFASKLTNYPFEIPEHPLAVSMTGDVPLVLRSDKGHMGITLNSPNTFANLGAGLSHFEGKFPGRNYFENEYNFVHVIAEQSEVYSQAVKEAYDKGKNSVEYPDSGLGARISTIARLISGGLKSKVYYLRLSNFDSHVQQMTEALSGQHPILLRQLSEAISLFMQDATIQGFATRVAGLTTSEFGRRAYDNGSRGSDHGAGNVMFMFAHHENIDSGRKGDIPNLADIDGNGNTRFNFDFRRLYADFMEVWFGASQNDVEEVFGEYIVPMGILKPRVSSLESSPIYCAGRPGFNVYPNPTTRDANIKFDLNKESRVSIMIANYEGRVIKTIHDGYMLRGTYDIPISINSQGRYMILVSVNDKRFTQPINIIR